MAMEKVLIAVGGNALYDKQENTNLSARMVAEVCRHIVSVLKQGYLPVITFGNGPQVGNLLNMAESAVQAYGAGVTLDTCVSWTQGEIGYGLSQELQKQLAQAGLKTPVIAVNTRSEVDPADPAFEKPSKPIGQFIDMDTAQRLFEERGWIVGPDANRGYRRLVPSPMPKAILEADAIHALIESGAIVLCGGGGGIPVGPDGHGIEAVIDKDFTSCLIARTLNIENMIICTEVENVYLNFGKPNQKALYRLSLEEARAFEKEGHFSAGSMGPKVAALIDYVAHGGKRAFITSLEKLTDALAGNAGTEIYDASVKVLH